MSTNPTSKPTKWSPWVAAFVGLSLVLSGFVRGTYEGSWAYLVGFSVIGIPTALLLGSLWLSRSRQFRAVGPQEFYSSAVANMALMAQIPHFAEAAQQSTHLDFTSGLVGGCIHITAEGVRWAPSAMSARFRRVPVFDLAWHEVVSVKPERHVGLDDPATLTFVVAGGYEWTLKVAGFRRLDETIEYLTGSGRRGMA